MSLLQLRRDRKDFMRGGPQRPPSIWKLLAALVLVAFLLWKLSHTG